MNHAVEKMLLQRDKKWGRNAKFSLEIRKSISSKSCLREWCEHWMVGEGFRPQWQGQSRQCILPRPLLSWWSWRNVHHLSDCRRACWGEKTFSCWWIWQHLVSFSHKIKNSNWPPWSSLCPCTRMLNLDTWTPESPAAVQATKMRCSRVQP